MNLSFLPDSRRHIIVWLVALGLLLTAVTLFLELAEDIWLNEGFAWVAAILLSLHRLSQPALDSLFWLITQTAGPLIVVPVVGTAVWFWRRGRRTTMLLVISSFVGSVLLNSLLKLLFARPRPNLFTPLVVEHSYSFPSGHTMSAAAVYGLLALLLWQQKRPGWAVLAGLWVPLIALSRIYLGVHYPSDVLASLAIGLIWLILVWFTTRGCQHNADPNTPSTQQLTTRPPGNAKKRGFC